MKQRREKEPPVYKGDRILIERGGPGGYWDVLSSRWKSLEDAADDRVEMVLGRGGTSMAFKTVFNTATMRHISQHPEHILARDLNVGKPIKLKRAP